MVIIIVFISIGPCTNDRRWLHCKKTLIKNIVVKILEFYFWKWCIWCILLAFVVTIICGHWTSGGHVSPGYPLNTHLNKTEIYCHAVHFLKSHFFPLTFGCLHSHSF